MKNVSKRLTLMHKIELMRKALPSLIAEEIVGVQPMIAESGKVFTIKYIRRSLIRKFWDAVVNKWYTARGYEQVPTKWGCFGPIEYGWKKKND